MADNCQNSMTIWRNVVCSWYPDYEKKTYFVPPVVLTRMQFNVVSVAGHSALVPVQQRKSVYDPQGCLKSSACTGVSTSQPAIVSGTLHEAMRKRGQQKQPQSSSATACRAWVEPHHRQVRTQECDQRSDITLQVVLFAFKEMTRECNQIMFVISQLSFSSYLGNSCYSASAQHFIVPKQLDRVYRQGDFDILVIHRHYGLWAGEIKSVHSNMQDLNKPEPLADQDIVLKLRESINQLDKSETVLREITKDLQPNLPIHKTIIMPYVSIKDLQRVTSGDKTLEQDLIACLKASNLDQAIEWCLLADMLPALNDGWKAQQLLSWWEKRFAIDSHPAMTLDLYLDLLARFCGPATSFTIRSTTSPRVEVRTEGQGVSALGDRMMTLILTPQQLSLLTRTPPKVMLSGGPGVGKSVMLLLRAIDWLRQGQDVYLACVSSLSWASSCLLNQMIEMNFPQDSTTQIPVGKVNFRVHLFYEGEREVTTAIDTIKSVRTAERNLLVVCDEFDAVPSVIDIFHQFVTKVCSSFSDVSFWAASSWRDQIPKELREEPLTIPLRCPTTVLREVELAVRRYQSAVHPYLLDALPLPCDGLSIKYVIHGDSGHDVQLPVDCRKCGRLIADILKELYVGSTVFNNDIKALLVVDYLLSKVPRTSDTSTVHFGSAICKSTSAKSHTIPPPLEYRDVFVLTRSTDLCDEVTDEDGRVLSHATGLVSGLRSSGIPVRVIRMAHLSKDVLETAMAQHDMVTVTSYAHVFGLERKVVVWLSDRTEGDDDCWSDDEIEAYGRFHAMSRCTAQLIVVKVQPGSQEDSFRVMSTKL